MSQHLDREQSTANGPDDRMDGVPRRVDPRNFVGKKLQKIKNARDNNNSGMAEHFE